MNRKHITFWLFFFLSLPIVSSAQQATQADIQALEKRVQSLETKVSNLDTTVKEMDKRLATQFQAVNVQINGLDERLNVQINELDKRLTARIDLLFWAIGVLIAIVLAVIALPQLLGYFQEKRARADFQKEVEELKQRLEQQQQEIEAIKSQRLVMPS